MLIDLQFIKKIREHKTTMTIKSVFFPAGNTVTSLIVDLS